MSVTVILQLLSCPLHLLSSLGNYLDHTFLLHVWIPACLHVPACKPQFLTAIIPLHLCITILVAHPANLLLNHYLLITSTAHKHKILINSCVWHVFTFSDCDQNPRVWKNELLCSEPDNTSPTLHYFTTLHWHFSSLTIQVPSEVSTSWSAFQFFMTSCSNSHGLLYVSIMTNIMVCKYCMCIIDCWLISGDTSSFRLSPPRSSLRYSSSNLNLILCAPMPSSVTSLTTPQIFSVCSALQATWPAMLTVAVATSKPDHCYDLFSVPEGQNT